MWNPHHYGEMQMVFIGEKNCRGSRSCPLEKEALTSRVMYAYEITLDYLTKGFLIDLGRC